MRHPNTLLVAPFVGQPFLKTEVLFYQKSLELKYKRFNVSATVIRHIDGRKIHVYKMRPKKKTRKMFGFRPKLTRIYINAINYTCKKNVPIECLKLF